MRPTTTPPGSPRAPTSVLTRRQRKAAAAPLSDVTNLLLPETPTPIKPRRTGLRPLPTPSTASSTCSSTASVTPAPTKPSPAAVLGEERSAVKSPISTVYARRGAAETQGRTTRRRKNPTTAAAAAAATNKGKEPVAAAGAASCPPWKIHKEEQQEGHHGSG
ncbi:unnamed protein product [Urochloa humidicola]